MPRAVPGQRFGGRQKGTPNKATASIKQILARVYTDEVQEQEWEKWRTHPDPRIAFETFKLAQAYQHGKPAQVIEFDTPTDLAFSDLAQPDGSRQANQPN